MSDTAPVSSEALAAPSPGWVGAPKQKDRVTLLDAARGLGVLGILPCNMPDFDTPLGTDEIFAWPLGQSHGSLAGWAVTQVFFQRRFITLFSMLFGVSVFLVGGERADAERGLILRKRLFVLLAIGLIHCFAIWWGDVLVTYAIGGFFMLLMRSFSARRLMTVGVSIWLVIAALYAFGALQAAVPPQHPPDIAKALKESAAHIAQYRANGFLGSLLANAKDGLMAQMIQPVVVPASLALMCIGLAAYKWGVFTGEAPRGVYWGLLGAGLASLVVVGLGMASFLIANLDRPAAVVGIWAQTVLAPPNSFAYLAILYFALGSRLWGWLPRMLAPVGQMAFTNYLTQSILMTALFYPGRGPGLYAKVDRPMLWVIVAAVWALQIVWSRIWLTYFTMGPLEWLWRRMYRGPAPLRRAKAGEPKLTAVVA